jgi:Uma2 family endonuclease
MALQTAPTQPTTYKFTVSQFEQMISEGIFTPAERVELLEGEILKMSPINHPHAAVVSNLEFIFRERLGRSAYIWAQQPLLLDDRSRLQPDVVLLKWRDDRYVPKPPTAEDVLLLIEVSDTSLTDDRGRKKAKYARSGIPEYWIVNLRDKVIEVFSAPVDGKYATESIADMSDTLSLPAGLDVDVAVDEIFGQANS